MIFGDARDFAIEADVDSEDRSSAVWGHMCVWCRGTPMGNLDDRYCALFPARHAFAHLLTDLDSLWTDELSGLTGQALWQILEALPERGVERFRFLTNWGEQFDGYDSHLVCPPNGEVVWIVSRTLPSSIAEVSREGFEKACAGFVAWFDARAAELAET